MTLIEIVVVIGVIALLIAISIPSLRSARATAREIRCVTHLREIGQLMTMYAGDHDDIVPHSVPDSPEFTQDHSQWVNYVYESAVVFSRDYFHSYANLEFSHELWYCPGDPVDYDTWPREAWQSAYEPVSALYIEQKYLDPNLPESVWSKRLGARLQRLGSTLFPSSKVGAYEQFIWHGWDGGYGPGVDIGGMNYQNADYPGSIWFIDGHAMLMQVSDALPSVDRYPIWGKGAYNMTEWGIAGRDIE